ncbi:unnamed protein product [Bemisia tabaci]|uniref:Uncharacterized protein n=1 Tax=Bemisia tabaci TaxID=7038 RepID=A0A9P0A914_BEMTA|nr:unnamed protein product [Bemisia tabaci]
MPRPFSPILIVCPYGGVASGFLPLPDTFPRRYEGGKHGQEENVNVSIGYCMLGFCWCRLNPNLRIPGAPNTWNKLTFLAAKAQKSYQYRRNFGSDASRKRAATTTPQHLAQNYRQKELRLANECSSRRTSRRRKSREVVRKRRINCIREMKDILVFQFSKSADIEVEKDKFLPLIKREFPALPLSGKKNINVLSCLKKLGMEKYTAFLEELGYRVPKSPDDLLLQINSTEQLESTAFLEDEVPYDGLESTDIPQNVCSGKQAELTKHLCKLTKEELERELAKHGVPYVYARTKDAADALAKI